MITCDSDFDQAYQSRKFVAKLRENSENDFVFFK